MGIKIDVEFPCSVGGIAVFKTDSDETPKRYVIISLQADAGVTPHSQMFVTLAGNSGERLNRVPICALYFSSTEPHRLQFETRFHPRDIAFIASGGGYLPSLVVHPLVEVCSGGAAEFLRIRGENPERTAFIMAAETIGYSRDGVSHFDSEFLGSEGSDPGPTRKFNRTF